MKIVLRFLFLVKFTVSETDLLVESQLCGIVSPKGLFGVVSSFSTVLFFQVISVAGALNLRLI
ncbi:hypothetical protein [Vibrio parahaemolyticus]|uniref:hypothetical protein n=1 Tax=Vibrio parahaemolyticus TaxID=670 RepID=UPI0021520E6A|nr:hypothetical protein [Vibrio parahaemolyticus]